MLVNAKTYNKPITKVTTHRPQYTNRPKLLPIKLTIGLPVLLLLELIHLIEG